MSQQKSTNGRTGSTPTAPQPVRLVFRLLEATAPAVGAGWLDRLWFRLPPVPERARRARVELPAGEPFAVAMDGRLIRGTSWGTGRTVYLVHGWGGWALQLAAYVPPLVDAGYRVITYDAPSHGASEAGYLGPRSSTLPEMADALRAVVAAHGPAYGVIAHSFGAAATTHAILHGLTAQRMVFVSAAVAFEDTLDQFQQALGFGPRIRAGFQRRFIRRFGRSLQSFDLGPTVDDILEERNLPPLLAIHDTGDRETPYQGSADLVAAWPGARLELTEGLGHRKVLGAPAAVAAVVGFLTAAEGVDGRSGDPAGHDTMQG